MHKVRAALVTAFMATDTGIPASAVTYENRPRPEAPGDWIMVHFLPGPRKVYTLGTGGLDVCRGILQIDVNAMLQSGESAAANAYTALSEAFTAGQRLIFEEQEVSILACSRSRGTVLDTWYRVPITVSWEAYLIRKVL